MYLDSLILDLALIERLLQLCFVCCYRRYSCTLIFLEQSLLIRLLKHLLGNAISNAYGPAGLYNILNISLITIHKNQH